MVYLTKTGGFNRDNILVISSLLLSFTEVSSRFISDDGVFFHIRLARESGIGLKWKQCCFCCREKSIAKGNCPVLQFNVGYFIRYIWRLFDVLGRLLILSLVWIVLGGQYVIIIFLIDTFVIIAFILLHSNTASTDMLTFLIASYVKGKNFSKGFKSMDFVMKFCIIWRMVENIVQLAVVTFFLLTNGGPFTQIIKCYFCDENAWTFLINNDDTRFGESMFPFL